MAFVKPNMKALGQHLRRARGEESRAEIARRTGVGAGHIQKLEEGKLTGLTLVTLAKLADGYHISPLDLLATTLDIPASDLDQWAQERVGTTLLSDLSERIDALHHPPFQPPLPSTPAPTGLTKELLQDRIAEWLLIVQRDSGEISLREVARRADVPSTTVAAAATGKAGTSLLLVLIRVASIWPGGSLDDAVTFWLHGTASRTDPQDTLKRSARRIDETLRGLAPILEHLQAAASDLERAAGQALAPREQLEALAIENRLLKAQLRPQADTSDITEDALTKRLNRLRQERQLPHTDLTSSSPSSPTVDD